MEKEDLGKSFQVAENKTNISWLMIQASKTNDKLEAIQDTLFKMLIALIAGAFGFIGTLLVTLLNLG